MSLINTDKISTWMGSPPHHWKVSETQQMRNIHRCFRNAYNAANELNDEVAITGAMDDDNVIGFGNGKEMRVKQKRHRRKGEELGDGDEMEQEGEEDVRKDEEDFLPQDSCLRSKEGDKKVPQNPPFKDYTQFTLSLSFDYWRKHFEQNVQDKFLAEIASSIVSNICLAQAKHEMRVHNGYLPMRKKREHITPLALVLHEIKLWCVQVMKSSDVNNEGTFKEIRCRVRYLDALSHKEVWGDAVMILAQGMRALAHDKLFRLFLSAKESLTRAEEYAYRCYNRRSSREKLLRIKNLLKDVVLNEMRTLSNRMTLEEKLSEPKTSRLQPTDLLNTIENQTFVNYKNMVNVCLYKMCQNPLVRATMTADYDGDDVKEIIRDISEWSEQNLFCVPNTSETAGEPIFKMEKKKEYRILPEIYAPTAAELKRLIREIDNRSPVPDSAKTVITKLNKAFGTDDNSARVVQFVMKNAAAIMDLVPAVYAMHQLWTLAGDGGDFTIYDTMREHVIRVMQNVIERVDQVRKSGSNLAKAIHQLAELKEESMKKEALKKGKRKYKPAWIMNHKFIAAELQTNVQSVYDNTMTRLFEVARDARDYTLTSDQLSDKVHEAKKMLDALVGVTTTDDAVDLGLDDKENPDTKKKTHRKSEWLNSDNGIGGFEEFGKNNAFGDQNSFAFGSDANGGFDNKFDSDEDE